MPAPPTPTPIRRRPGIPDKVRQAERRQRQNDRRAIFRQGFPDRSGSARHRVADNAKPRCCRDSPRCRSGCSCCGAGNRQPVGTACHRSGGNRSSRRAGGGRSSGGPGQDRSRRHRVRNGRRIGGSYRGHGRRDVSQDRRSGGGGGDRRNDSEAAARTGGNGRSNRYGISAAIAATAPVAPKTTALKAPGTVQAKGTASATSDTDSAKSDSATTDGPGPTPQTNAAQAAANAKSQAGADGGSPTKAEANAASAAAPAPSTHTHTTADAAAAQPSANALDAGSQTTGAIQPQLPPAAAPAAPALSVAVATSARCR